MTSDKRLTDLLKKYKQAQIYLTEQTNKKRKSEDSTLNTKQ